MKKMIEEFKKFIAKGSVIDLAVGVIIGGAFGKIVSSLVNDILMPILGIILGGYNFDSLNFVVGDSIISYGLFIKNIVDFFVIALCIFLFIKLFNKITDSTKISDTSKKKESKSTDEKILILVTEIRDLLKKE